MKIKIFRIQFLLMALFMLSSLGIAQAANERVDCLDSGNCSDLVYTQHQGKITARCHSSATASSLPVKITLNGDVYTGTLDCSNNGGNGGGGSSTTGPWTIGPWGTCTQECGGGQQFRDVTCGYDSCDGVRPAESQACNTHACENCNADSWFGDDPANICVGQQGVQTNECGDERNVDGTWNPQDWSPHPSVVCSFDTFYQGTSCGQDRESSGSRDCQPTWQWLRPADPEPLVSANVESDFNNLRLTGDLYYAVAGKGFFDVNDVRAARVVLISAGNEYEYAVNLRDITFTDRGYDFLVDLSVLQTQTPAGAAGPINFSDGDWSVDVMFEHKHDGMANYAWVRNSDSGQFVLDSTAPSGTTIHRQTADSDAQEYPDTLLTNEPGFLWVNCVDSGAAGCLGDVADLDADSTVDNYQPFAVKGNFCPDGAVCDTSGTRSFEICDRADNCSLVDAVLDNYDPIAPSPLDFVMGLQPGGAGFLGTVLKASADYFPNLDFVDPGEVIERGTPSIVGSRAYITPDDYDQIFDEHACGDPSVSPFAHNEADGQCELQNKNYPASCETLASCPDPCPAGYFWDEGLNRCEQAPTCTDTTWTPLETSVCSGTDFTQVSNCGNRRSRTGSKDCSATSNWRITQPPLCPIGCGQSAQTLEGAVTCPGTDCDPAEEPAVPTRSCAATEVCPPSFSGTWEITQPEACSTACGLGEITLLGSVRCSTGNPSDCDPALEPTVPTRLCNATATCPPTFTGTWSTNPAPQCPTNCGEPASTKTGSVSCSDNNCDPAQRPTTPTQTCSATATCPPTFTGTWTANPAPACSTACGQSASTQTGTVTCSDNNCDPSAKPAARTRSCSATASCQPVTTCNPVDYDFDGWCRRDASNQTIPMCNNINFMDSFCGGDPNCTLRNMNMTTNTCAVCRATFEVCITTTPNSNSTNNTASNTTPTYDGTWSTTPAPQCPTAYCAFSTSGAVNCSTEDCDPALRPAVPRRDCLSTAVCQEERQFIENLENNSNNSDPSIDDGNNFDFR